MEGPRDGSPEVVGLLKSLFGSSRKLMIITYNLPVVLRKNVAGKWTASWIEDDYLARTPHSIADDVPTIWIGCITRECLNARAADDRRQNSASYSSLSAAVVESSTPRQLPAPEWHAPGLAPLLPEPTGGIPSNDSRLLRDRSVQLPISTNPPPPILSESLRARSYSVPEQRTGDTITFEPEDMEELTLLLNGMNIVPIFFPTDLHEAFFRYCMSVLRPGLHNVLETGSQRIFPGATSLEYLREGWAHYLAANESVARVVFSLYRDGDVIWINDFQLSMMPRFLSKWCIEAYDKRPPQLFFLHAPFPTSEIFRTMPVRDDLLESIMECDVIGFHAFNYARHFLHAAKRLLGVSFQSRWGGQLALDVNGRDAMVAISHVGVEAAALERWMASEQAAQVARSFALRHPGKVIIAGIDSCQRLSGVALKLLAFDRLLEENKVYRSKVVLVQRCEMRQAMSEDMLQTATELRDRVAKIRSMYGDVVDYEEAPSFSPTYRMGLFHQADILLQTPIREGINLLSLEYVYARTQWQIQRSKAFEDDVAAAAAASGAATPGGNTSADTNNAAHSALKHDNSDLASVTEGSLPDAALKAISQGMPESYATLAAPPSSSVRAHKQRPSVLSLFSKSARTVTGGDATAPAVVTSDAGAPPSPGPTVGRGPTGGSEAGSAPSVSIPAPLPTVFETVHASETGSLSPALAPFSNLVAPLPPPLRGGCVILSEFAAASHILNSNLLVNPWNIARVAKEIDTALTMPDHERSFRQWRDYKYAVKTPAAIWSRRVIADVLETRAEAERAATAAPANATAPAAAESSEWEGCRAVPRTISSSTLGAASLPPLDVHSTIRAFLAAPSRLLVFDYGGTIMNRSDSALEFTADGYSRLIPQKVVDALAGLSQDPRNTIFIVSGKRSAAVEALHLARIPHIGLAAENGWLVSLPAHAASVAAAARLRHQVIGKTCGNDTPVHIGASLGFEIADTLGEDASSNSPEGSPSLRNDFSVAAVQHLHPMHHAHSAPAAACRKWAPLAMNSLSSRHLSDWQRIKNRALEIMLDYQWRVNGSCVREYESIVAWDFHNADAEWAQSQAKFMAADLSILSAAVAGSVQVNVRKKRVELSMRAVNKGRLVASILDTLSQRQSRSSSELQTTETDATAPAFVLTAGDDVTDEEMFVAAQKWTDALPSPSKSTTINVLVGRHVGTSAANFSLPSVADMQAFIVALYDAVVLRDTLRVTRHADAS